MQHTAHVQTKRSRGRFEFCLNDERRTTALSISSSNVDMATNANLSEPSDSEKSSLSDCNLSSQSSNRSLRVAEKERRKNEAEDPFVLALKYFSDGRIQTYAACCAASLLPWSGFRSFASFNMSSAFLLSYLLTENPSNKRPRTSKQPQLKLK